MKSMSGENLLPPPRRQQQPHPATTLVIMSRWMTSSKTLWTTMVAVGGDEDAAVMDPQGAELMEEIANRHDEDDILFGSPRWMENFKEMKQAAIDPLYNGCPKHWTALRFNLQMLMLKAQHGLTDTGFNDFMSVLFDILPEGNKVPANTNRVKKLIRPVVMKLRKFDACTNHCILYRGEQYEKLESCPHCDTSRYKRNAGCRVDTSDEGPTSGGPNKKKRTGIHAEERTCAVDVVPACD
uniref:UPI0001A89096 related cluster n=1 Tax=Saccharum spontaneum TaxID=62335 RepID=A0A678TPX7_SACSP|nr:UPI0001A89096 related cluster [Saccharum spontaneum]